MKIVDDNKVLSFQLSCHFHVVVYLSLQEKRFNTKEKVVAITTNVIVIRCYCNDKKVNASHCNKVQGNRLMQH